MTFRRLLIEDRADRINHIWYFLLLLLLSLATWLLAATPSLYPEMPEINPETNTRRVNFKYTARCWCPVEFSVWMVEYYQSSCSASFYKTMSDDEEVDNATIEYTRLYYPPSPDTDNLDLTRFTRDSVSNVNKKSRSYDIQKLLKKTSVVLLSLALSLQMTRTLWIIYLGWAAQSLFYFLDSFQTGLRQDEASTEKYIRKFVNNITQTIKPSSLSTSLFYLFTKLLQTAIAISGAVAIWILLQECVGISRDETYVGNAHYHGIVLLCKADILQGANLYQYSVMCMFTADSVFSPSEPSYANDTTEQEHLLLVLYDSVTKIVFLLMIILSIHNTYNFLVWQLKLMPGYFRRKLISGSMLPMHSYLLVNMVMENVGYMEALQIKAAIAIINTKSKTQQENDEERV